MISYENLLKANWFSRENFQNSKFYFTTNYQNIWELEKTKGQKLNLNC